MIKFTTFTILFLLFVFPVLMIIPIKMIPSNDQPGYDGARTVSVYGERTFSQVFLSTSKNLMGIGTSIKNPNLKNKKEIKLSLFDENDSLIRISILNGFNIGDGDYVKFTFEPIIDSMDKKYHFTISSPTAGEEEVIKLFITEPTDKVLEYTYDDEVKKGGIPMVAFHKPSNTREKMIIIYSNLISKL